MGSVANIERYVVESVTSHGSVPTHAELTAKFGFSEIDRPEFASQRATLERLWGLNTVQLKKFFDKIARSDPKPKDIQGLMYLVAQTELEDAMDGLRKA